MTPLVRATALTKTYTGRGATTTALHETSFEVGPGELTLLMGPSGSGKTTLISILVGLMTPTSGTVELCGESLMGLSESGISRIRRDRVGFVFQTDNLFPSLTAFDNVVEVLRLKGMATAAARAAATSALSAVGLADRMNHKPGELSGGQRQRVAVARALASAPELLVGDEITAALDSESAMQVMANVRAGVTPTTSAIIVTHDRRLVQFADRVIEMEDGRITKDWLTARAETRDVA